MGKFFKKHSSAEKARLYGIYRQQQWAGKSLEQVASELKVSRSTLLRWQREEFGVAFDVLKPPKSIGDIITGLCEEDRDLSSFDLLFDVCAFNAWLRWPVQPKYHYSAIISSILQYASLKYDVDSLINLPPGYRDGIIEFFSLTQVADLFSPQTDRQCDFTQHLLQGQNYTELQVSANLARYILSAQKPTVAGAFEALKAGIDGHRYQVSWSSYQDFWRSNLPASPFLYVQDYYSGLKWTSNPFAAYFVEFVDEILVGTHERRRFFSDAQAAFDQIRARIDPRSSSDVFASIAFPCNLPVPTIPIVSMPAAEPAHRKNVK